MSSWASKQRLFYSIVVLVVVGLPLGLFLYFTFYKAPTCFDGWQNGGEQGVDCGGPCVLLCDDQAIEPIVLWQRFFRLAPGFYNAVAYIENPNSTAWATELPYIFKIYDTEGVLMHEGLGVANLPPRATTPIFQTDIGLGERLPARITFEFTGEPIWQKDEDYQKVFQIESFSFSRLNSLPRADVRLKNTTFEVYSNVELVAVLFNSQGNAIGASKTYLPKIDREEVMDLVFTWPTPFSSQPIKVEVSPVY